MQTPQYGALGAALQLARVFQMCSLIAIIGMTANFISEIVSNDLTPPDVLIGTISVACTVIIYCIITSILYLDDILPFLATAIMDTLCLVAVIVVAVIVGKPLSYLKCSEIGNEAAASSKTSAYAFTRNLDSVVDQISGKVVKYVNWIGMSRAVCLETKAVWGLTIALCILFFFSAVCSMCLWRQKKRAGAQKLDG